MSPPTGLFRLALAVLVVLQHATTSILPVSVGVAIKPFELGSLAVLVFFIVSGFIIAQVAHTTYRDRPFAFLSNRLLRLVPTYWAALAATGAVLAGVSASGLAGPIAAELAQTPHQPLTNFAVNALAILPGSPAIMRAFNVEPVLDLVWALRIEVLFYATIGFALLSSQRLAVPVGQTLTIAAGASLLAYLPLIERWRGGSFEFAPYFVLGAAVYFVALCAGDRSCCPRDRSWPIAIAAAAGVAIVLHQWGRPPNHETGFARNLMAQYALLAVGISIWLALVFIVKSVPSKLARRDQLAGDLTYPLYLAHVAALVLVQAVFPTPSWAATGAAFALSLALAALLVIAIERPVARLRARIRTARVSQPRGMARATSL